MKNKRRLKILLAIIIVLILCYKLNYNPLKKEDKKHIVVITKVTDINKIKNMHQGFQQAVRDMDIDLDIITLKDKNTAKEQLKLLDEALNEGVDGVIISPSRYKIIKDKLEKVDETLPVTIIESFIDENKNYSMVASDNYKIGTSLASEVLRHGNTKGNILLFHSGEEEQKIVDIKAGIYDELKSSKNKTFEVDKSLSKEELKSEIENNKIDVVMALDEDSIKTAIEVKRMQQKNIEVYGTGYCNSLLQFLEDDEMISAVIQDEFSIGYLAVKYNLDDIYGKETVKDNIDYKIIDREHMYIEENQRLLFPFIE